MELIAQTQKSLFCGHMNQNVQFFLESMESTMLRTKEERHHLVYQPSIQRPASLIDCGFMSAYGISTLHIWKGKINERSFEKIYGGFRSVYIYSHLDHGFFRTNLTYFSKTMVNHIMQLLQQHDFEGEESSRTGLSHRSPQLPDGRMQHSCKHVPALTLLT